MNKKSTVACHTMYPAGMLFALFTSFAVSILAYREYLETQSFPIKTVVAFFIALVVVLILAAILTYWQNRNEKK